MRRCAVIMADLYPAATLEELPGAAGAPRLPALEYLLARADVTREPAGRIPGWYGWLARQWDAPDAARAPAACVAAALGIDAPAWLLTPLHYQASLDTVRLHHAGLLSLSPDEQQELADDFARVFAGSGWLLHSTGARELLLSGSPDNLSVDVNPGGVDPARLLGGSLATGQPQGEGAAELRRLSSEIELWLHEHAVNRRRRGSALTVSGLWPWGGGRGDTTPKPAATAATELHGGDLFSISLARQCGVASIAADSGSTRPQTSPAGDRFVVAGMRGGDVFRAVQECEARWLEPALRAWRTGRYSLLHLVSDERVWTLAPRHRWRFWRRARAWPDGLLRC
jgi:hypothetical protein